MQKLLSLFILASGGFLLANPSVVAQSVPINLNTWNQESASGNGNWTVAPDGNSVFQSINGNPTFFVSPDDFINTTFNGEFQVQTTGDDDYIGFVFGYQSPLAANGDAVNDYDFFLFDWKQNNQTSGGQLAQEGFTLSRVQGTINDFLPGFWGHNDSTEFDVLATDYGSTRGWADNTEYDFTLLYQEDRITIDIQGGTDDFASSQRIFNITPGDVGLSTFQSGKFGFYNYSQASVRYQGFTQQDTPPNPDNQTVPEPSMLLSMLAIAGLGSFFGSKSKQD